MIPSLASNPCWSDMLDVCRFNSLLDVERFREPCPENERDGGAMRESLNMLKVNVTLTTVIISSV